MGIRDEFESSQQYMLTTEPFDLGHGKGIELVQLTDENVAKVEAMIRNDSSYVKSFGLDFNFSNSFSFLLIYYTPLYFILQLFLVAL